MSVPSSHPELDFYPALPWSRGNRTLFLCPRPQCRGSACCPAAREHLLIPVDRQQAQGRPLTAKEWARQRRREVSS